MSRYSQLVDLVRDRVDELTEEVEDIAASENDRYLAAVSSLLADLLPGDLIAWNAVNIPRSEAEVRSQSSVDHPEVDVEDVLARLGMDNPMVRSYLVGTGGAEPRRLSDLVGFRELSRTRAYAELYRPMAVHDQLTILTTRNRGAGTGRCWGVNRSVGTFSDRELAIAGALQPALALLDRVFAAPASARVPAASTNDVLTPRETSVMRLLADGLSATQIARILRVAPATVRKHLEHAYAKLNAHDRLLAVNRARALGYLETRGSR